MEYRKWLVTLAALLACPASVWAQDERCTSQETPIGALPPAVPIWCLPAGANGPATFVEGDNAWVDDFEHGLSNAPMGMGYREFPLGGTTTWQHFRHANHWMQDVKPTAGGGIALRPDRTFEFEDGKLVVETDFAAGLQTYGGDAWGEIVITTGPEPNTLRRGTLYAYDYFGGHWTLGCRLQTDRHTICSLFNDTKLGLGEGGREWEMSFFQHVGTHVEGGGPWGEGDRAFRVCEGNDPDINCRDRFRLELTANSLTIYVNDYKYFEQSGIPQLPAALTQGPLYVYFAGVIWRSLPGDETLRFHWDRVSVNPGSAPTQPPPPPPPAVCRTQRQEADGSWTTVEQPVPCP